VWREPRLAGFKPSDYETLQVFYSSADGTRVPMFITARRGMHRDGNTPTILYGYGGFNISIEPTFSPRSPHGLSAAASTQWRICAAAESTGVLGMKRG